MAHMLPVQLISLSLYGILRSKYVMVNILLITYQLKTNPKETVVLFHALSFFKVL